MQISVTDLSSYDYCKRRLFLTKVLKLVKPPKDVMVRGTVRHKATEKIANIEEELVRRIGKGSGFEQIMHSFKQEHGKILRKTLIDNKELMKSVNLDLMTVFRDLWAGLQKETERRVSTINNFMLAENTFGVELWDKLQPKIKTELWMESDALSLRGYLDQLEVYCDKSIPLELKTGSAPREGVWPGHKMQIGAYCLLAKENIDKNISFGYIHYLDVGSLRKVAINPFLESEIQETTTNVKKLFQHKEIPDFCGNENKCKSCNLKDFCFNETLLNQKIQEI